MDFCAARGCINDEIERQQSILGVEVPEVRYSLELTEARTAEQSNDECFYDYNA